MDSLLRSEALRNRQKQMLHPPAKWQGGYFSREMMKKRRLAEPYQNRR